MVNYPEKWPTSENIKDWAEKGIPDSWLEWKDESEEFKQGLATGYNLHKKEIEEAQTKAVELEAKLEDEAEGLKQQGIKDEDGQVLDDEEVDFGERASKEE